LRTKRRRANHLALIDAASDLFAERGFSQTTMEDIADAADLHVQTLYRHFPTKNALAAAIDVEAFRQAVASRETDALAFWRAHVGASAKGVMRRDGGALFLQYVTNPAQDPKLKAARADLRIGSQDILTEAIGEDFDLEGLSPHLPILIANMLWGGNADAVGRWSEQGSDDLSERVVATADTVIEIVLRDLGLEARRRRT
jgi:AcrR family transcriptional regulator